MTATATTQKPERLPDGTEVFTEVTYRVYSGHPSRLETRLSSADLGSVMVTASSDWRRLAAEAAAAKFPLFAETLVLGRGLTLDYLVRCAPCAATFPAENCGACDGTGMAQSPLVPCDDCQQSGLVCTVERSWHGPEEWDTCPRCDGSGWVPR
jgi:hypothetical protein